MSDCFVSLQLKVVSDLNQNYKIYLIRRQTVVATNVVYFLNNRIQKCQMKSTVIIVHLFLIPLFYTEYLL